MTFRLSTGAEVQTEVVLELFESISKGKIMNTKRSLMFRRAAVAVVATVALGSIASPSFAATKTKKSSKVLTKKAPKTKKTIATKAPDTTIKK